MKLGSVLLACLLCLTFWADPAVANPLIRRLPPGNAVTDGQALLRYALPIENDSVRKLQDSIEEISELLRVSRRNLSPISSKLARAERILSRSETALLPSVREDQQADAAQLIEQMRTQVTAMYEAIDTQDKDALRQHRQELLALIGQLEADMVQGYPFEVPAEYSHLPQLKGRATIAMTTSKGVITLVVDGYNAPVTAGNFVDLVQRGFYDGLEFTRAEDLYYIQAGDPPGDEQGFVDPATGQYRSIPLEIMVRGDSEPTYGITLEEAGRYLDPPVLPFAAYGTVAMARPDTDPNGGSSQFFFFLFEPELTPAGYNLIDGRYAAFGYVVDGKDVLRELRQGDVIESAQVTQGAENLVQPIS